MFLDFKGGRRMCQAGVIFFISVLLEPGKMLDTDTFFNV
jgi:hypothetical protein